MRLGVWTRAVAATVLTFSLVPVAQAQGPAEFYKGKNLDLYIGYTGGGGYDVYARALARTVGRYIPGHPTIVPKNMPTGSTTSRPRTVPRSA